MFGWWGGGGQGDVRGSECFLWGHLQKFSHWIVRDGSQNSHWNKLSVSNQKFQGGCKWFRDGLHNKMFKNVERENRHWAAFFNQSWMGVTTPWNIWWTPCSLSTGEECMRMWLEHIDNNYNCFWFVCQKVPIPSPEKNETNSEGYDSFDEDEEEEELKELTKVPKLHLRPKTAPSVEGRRGVRYVTWNEAQQQSGSKRPLSASKLFKNERDLWSRVRS